MHPTAAGFCGRAKGACRATDTVTVCRPPVDRRGCRVMCTLRSDPPINGSDGRADATVTESDRLCAGVCMFATVGVDEEMFIGGAPLHRRQC